MSSGRRLRGGALLRGSIGRGLLRLAIPCISMLGLGGAAREASAQDRVVGREALDPGDQDRLGPAVDGRTDAPEDADPRALEEFEAPLAPHGTWVEDAEYGTVWVPHEHEVGADFYPYSTGGHWELTADADWIWVSDYRWGHIPFHYGRWVWIGHRGWAWIPGRVWAPAWVVWRTGPYGYIGWAPCPPTWTWWGGSALWLWWPPPAAYVFVETRHVFHHHVHHHHVRDRARVQNAAAKTSPQRTPARPDAPSYARSRPSSPSLPAIRYDGPQPSTQAKQRHPEIGHAGPAPKGNRRMVRTAEGRRSKEGLTPRDDAGRFSQPRDRGRAPTAGGQAPTAGRGAGSPSRAAPPESAPPGEVQEAAPRGRGPESAPPSPEGERTRPSARPDEGSRPSRGPRVEGDRPPRFDARRPGASAPGLRPAPRPSAAPFPPRAAPRPGPTPTRRGRGR